MQYLGYEVLHQIWIRARHLVDPLTEYDFDESVSYTAPSSVDHKLVLQAEFAATIEDEK